jgi:hypothetical protein
VEHSILDFFIVTSLHFSASADELAFANARLFHVEQILLSLLMLCLGVRLP